ncbi:MAG: hypothetical protein UT48_C0018G0007 [Parcubacteria group bacterium GW2011_GWE2_39_37]|uniref:Uncharacterized protein n=1 Tax=Candidatus Falkowbacteria bacterium GW2011_GWF2_39_8 TaxID=1618642 RepID=A0A0G0Q011_9BACT|nr:MAG: hypothetical protein UT48_C0018G0007 [Parcubacteria group bacterium GW2011_GWE2_39_37]KKR33503.1 MAG: hypothetical protein UT64_C0007G0005 [Candidatus Falkowbacteria bacterium GW2011_GWF2_39_8]
MLFNLVAGFICGKSLKEGRMENNSRTFVACVVDSTGDALTKAELMHGRMLLDWLTGKGIHLGSQFIFCGESQRHEAFVRSLGHEPDCRDSIFDDQSVCSDEARRKALNHSDILVVCSGGFIRALGEQGVAPRTAWTVVHNERKLLRLNQLALRQ